MDGWMDGWMDGLGGTSFDEMGLGIGLGSGFGFGMGRMITAKRICKDT